jgi:hypothetical protein
VAFYNDAPEQPLAQVERELATLKIFAEVLYKTREMKIVGTTPKIFTLFFFIFEVMGEVDVVQLEEINALASR